MHCVFLLDVSVSFRRRSMEIALPPVKTNVMSSPKSIHPNRPVPSSISCRKWWSAVCLSKSVDEEEQRVFFVLSLFACDFSPSSVCCWWWWWLSLPLVELSLRSLHSSKFLLLFQWYGCIDKNKKREKHLTHTQTVMIWLVLFLAFHLTLCRLVLALFVFVQYLSSISLIRAFVRLSADDPFEYSNVSYFRQREKKNKLCQYQLFLSVRHR